MYLHHLELIRTIHPIPGNEELTSNKELMTVYHLSICASEELNTNWPYKIDGYLPSVPFLPMKNSNRS
jgi:hypothetical protein